MRVKFRNFHTLWNQLLFLFFLRENTNRLQIFALQQSCREQKKRSTRKFVNSHASHFDEFFSRFKIVAEAFNMAHRNNFWYMIAYHFMYFLNGKIFCFTSNTNEAYRLLSVQSFVLILFFFGIFFFEKRKPTFELF